MIGSILVKLAFAAALCSAGAYFMALRNSRESAMRIARSLYHVAAVSVLGFAAYLLYLILTHQFQYTYVWNYSSTTLPTPLLVSTFYAGQEGSFSLWTLYTVIIGVILIHYTSRRGYEAGVMSVWSSILTFLLLMLIVKNPFTLIWDSFPKDLLHTGTLPPFAPNVVWVDQAKGLWAQFPAEGKGLNPLLQNYWMVIHPQILFSGFSSMAVPFAFAMAGMIKRDYQGWVRVAKPWTVFSATVLGTGIILGGYWAYETLGWGGYWGWDPVENSSLIPWLFCVASIHTMMAQRRSGTFVRTNIALSLFTFIMVLYSTFLTRSGVLGETSVHSFVDPGMWAYWLLLGVIFVFGLSGLILFFVRMREMPKLKAEHTIYSREFALFLGASAIVLAAVFITIGTSSPIITRLTQGKASAVDISYYVKTTLPLGIIISLLAGFGQLLWWQRSTPAKILKSCIVPAAGALLFTIALVVKGVTAAPVLAFSFAAAFALIVNCVVGYRIFTGNPRYAGGAIAHIGLALLFLGFVSSAKYDSKQTVSLERGKPVSVLQNSYTLTYVGDRQIDADRYGFRVAVEHGGERYTLTPIMRYSEENQGVIRNPDILNLYTKDFYLSPLSLETPDETAPQSVDFMKGESKAISANISVKFVGFDFSGTDMEKMMQGGGFTIGATLEVDNNGKKSTVTPLIKNSGGTISYTPALLPGTAIQLTIVRMQPNNEDPSQSRVSIGVQDPSSATAPKTETLVVEASVKPYINLVWMGTVTLVVGFIITIIRRLQEARRLPADATETDESKEEPSVD
jgi:cytochrome c-type biogenesis protein CcmF